jgi:2'-5' RNA ligase
MNSSRQVPAGSPRDELRRRYDHLWNSVGERIRRGEIELDPLLAARKPDRRRGLTLIARPAVEVRRRVLEFLRRLRRLEPEQHYYLASELHVTVLSLFTATARPGPFFARQRDYRAAVDAAVRGAGPMRFEFRGVTASPGSILVQGFFDTEELNRLRDRLRQELNARGLGAGVDQRYRLETAHLTAVRFRAPLRQAGRLAEVLERSRDRSFGRAEVRSLALVRHDWYMTRRVQEVVERYGLSLGD